MGTAPHDPSTPCNDWVYRVSLCAPNLIHPEFVEEGVINNEKRITQYFPGTHLPPPQHIVILRVQGISGWCKISSDPIVTPVSPQGFC